jgi:hypothetical protein
MCQEGQALQLSAAAGSLQEERSGRGWVRVPPGPAESSAGHTGEWGWGLHCSFLQTHIAAEVLQDSVWWASQAGELLDSSSPSPQEFPGRAKPWAYV